MDIAWNDSLLRIFGLAALVGILSGALGLIGLLVGQAINLGAVELHYATVDVSKAGGIGGAIGFGLAVVIFVFALKAEAKQDV
ncbi:hypothetical protein AWB77_04643 [Caballeronia fortuita]|uniref:Uncharacterized protein n=1 Tax=Caballeronia fortuita TaxID=1777138 RepID=A0A158CWI6_9BURK|nr:hypothetical protein [Caballeronia fortuita]SAK86725.1 hypothetical protein AWB77_04643 [Caballeronia fortuita]